MATSTETDFITKAEFLETFASEFGKWKSEIEDWLNAAGETHAANDLELRARTEQLDRIENKIDEIGIEDIRRDIRSTLTKVHDNQARMLSLESLVRSVSSDLKLQIHGLETLERENSAMHNMRFDQMEGRLDNLESKMNDILDFLRGNSS